MIYHYLKKTKSCSQARYKMDCLLNNITVAISLTKSRESKERSDVLDLIDKCRIVREDDLMFTSFPEWKEPRVRVKK